MSAQNSVGSAGISAAEARRYLREGWIAAVLLVAAPLFWPLPGALFFAYLLLARFEVAGWKRRQPPASELDGWALVRAISLALRRPVWLLVCGFAIRVAVMIAGASLFFFQPLLGWHP